MKRWMTGLGVTCVACAFAVAQPPSEALAFSQSSPVTPTGHEQITVAGAKATGLASLNPTQGSEIGFAQGCDETCDTFDTDSLKVWGAVIGQRWTDIMGFKKIEQSKCFDAVAQNNEDVQYDHFLRKTTESGAAGGQSAYQGAIARFTWLFTQAAMQGTETIAATDGGAIQRTFSVPRAYFTFGRAVHIVEDSFSTEHVSRNFVGGDGRTILDVLSYTSTASAHYHTHKTPHWGNSSDGDVIFTNGVSGSLKLHAQTAVRALTDLWAAFERARAAPQTAQSEAQGFVNAWMKPAPNGIGNTYSSYDNDARSSAPSGTDVIPANVIGSWRSQCLGHTGQQTEPVPPGAPTGTQPLVLPPYAWSAQFHDLDIQNPAGTPTDLARSVEDYATGLEALADDVYNDLVAGWAELVADLDDFGTAALHLSHSNCIPNHVNSYATDRANDAVAKAQATVNNFWANATPVLSTITDPATKYAVGTAAFARLKAQFFDPTNGLPNYRDDRARFVRDWFVIDAHKSQAQTLAQQAYQTVMNNFSAALDRDLATRLPAPPAPPTPFVATAPTASTEAYEGDRVTIALTKAGVPMTVAAADGALSGSGQQWVYTAPASIATRRSIAIVFKPADNTTGQLVVVPIALRTKLHLQSRIENGFWSDGCPANINAGQHVTFRVKESTSVSWVPFGPSDEASVSFGMLTLTGVDKTTVRFYPPNATIYAQSPPSARVQASAPDGRVGACTVRTPGSSFAVTDIATANVRVTAGSKVTVAVMGYGGGVTDPMASWSMPDGQLTAASAQERSAVDAQLGGLRQLQSITGTRASAATRMQASLASKNGASARTDFGAMHAKAGRLQGANGARALALQADVRQHAAQIGATLAFASTLNGTFQVSPAGIGKTVRLVGKTNDGSNRSLSVRLTVVGP